MKNDRMDGLYQDLAGRFRALSQFFDKLGSEDTVQQLIESLIARDPSFFNNLVEAIDIPDIPPRLRCVVYRDMIDRVICDPYESEVCRLRSDLTTEERWQYFLIAWRYRQREPVQADSGSGFIVIGENPEIPPGPFLDELKANNLVTCKLEVRYNCRIAQVLGPPEWICI